MFLKKKNVFLDRPIAQPQEEKRTIRNENLGTVIVFRDRRRHRRLQIHDFSFTVVLFTIFSMAIIQD